MGNRLSAIKFVIIIVPSILLISYFLSPFLASFATSVIAVTGILTLVLGFLRYWRNKEQDTPEDKDAGDTMADQQQRPPDDQNGQSSDQSRESEDDAPDSTPDSSDTMPRNRSGLLKSDEEILDEVGEKLGDHISFLENGTIKFLDVDDLNMSAS